MQLTVIGAGYVGLVAGACFADAGHDVVCVDASREKIASLQAGKVPIYEEGLSDIVRRCVQAGRLAFTSDAHEALRSAAVVFVAVGTPPGEGGEADLSAVFAVAETVAQGARKDALLVLKSTVPVGTNERVSAFLAERGASHIEVVSNPEFLKEGVAIDDFRRPDRVVVGAHSERARELMRQLYEPFCRTGAPILMMDPVSAELAKYASNAMLATRISFMNAIAGICEAAGANVDSVRGAVGADKRIGPTFLFPGAGYGGSCFPKDVQALAATARSLGVPFALLEEVEAINARQKRLLADKVESALKARGGGLEGRSIAVWGLAFKPNTDDMREAPSLVVIRRLLELGAEVRAHDPVAMDRAREALAGEAEGGKLFFTSMYDALEGADALVIVTDWGEYRSPDFERMRAVMRDRRVFDGRNLWSPRAMSERGFHYSSVGRPPIAPL